MCNVIKVLKIKKKMALKKQQEGKEGYLLRKCSLKNSILGSAQHINSSRFLPVLNFDCIWLVFVSLSMLQQTHLAKDYTFEWVPFSQESHCYSPSYCCPNYNNIAALYKLAQHHSHCFSWLYLPNTAFWKPNPSFFFNRRGKL